MKPVYQTAFGEDGDCWRAAIASILEVSTKSVPDFVNKHPRGWWNATRQWLKYKGYAIVRFPSYRPGPLRDIACIGCFKLKRLPYGHAMIMRGSRVIHDPGGKRANRIYLCKKPEDFYYIFKT